MLFLCYSFASWVAHGRRKHLGHRPLPASSLHLHLPPRQGQAISQATRDMTHSVSRTLPRGLGGSTPPIRGVIGLMKNAKCLSSRSPQSNEGGRWGGKVQFQPSRSSQADVITPSLTWRPYTQASSITEQTQHQSWCLLCPYCVPSICHLQGHHPVVQSQGCAVIQDGNQYIVISK